MICGVENPDDPLVTCGLREEPTEHEFHYGYSKEIGNTEWPNPDYHPKVKLPTAGTPSTKAMAASVTETVLEQEHQAEESDIQRRFEEFHEKNPVVYERLVQMARDAKEKGHKELAIKMLWEVLRWEALMASTSDPSQHIYKLDNRYTSRYARLIMEQEPDLQEFFETRKLRS